MSRSDVSTLQLCLWMLRYARRRWRELLGSLAVMTLGAGLALLLPWPMKVLVDHVLDDLPIPPVLASVLSYLPGASARDGLLAWCIAASVLLFLAKWGVGLGTAFANIAFGQQMFYDLAADVYGHLQRLSLRFHGRRSVGDSIRRVTSDCHCISTIVRDAMLPAVSAVLTLAAMFLLMLRIDWLMTLVSMLVLPFLALVLRRYTDPMSVLGYQKQEIESGMYALVERTLSAIPAVQAFSAEERHDRQFQDVARGVLAATDAMTRAQLKFKILTGAVLAGGTAAVMWVGATHALEGQITIGTILVFISYLTSLYAPLEALMFTSSTVQEALGSARRVVELLSVQQDVQDRPGAPPLSPVRGHIRLEHVTFGYEPGRPILRGIDLEALPGQMVALVGATGAGKSTLISSVLRFFDPWEGRVTIDGHDLREVQINSVRRNVALVLQEAFLFPLTIAENIAYGHPEASRESIVSAAKAANAHEFIEQLSDGYDTLVGERGATLSGGQRQRISVARALLTNAPILILDEPTSALDSETERPLLEALDRLRQGRTTLIIAHRLSTVREADVIAVMDQGRVVEFGTHDELLRLGGQYCELHRRAFASPEGGRGRRIGRADVVLATAAGHDGISPKPGSGTGRNSASNETDRE